MDETTREICHAFHPADPPGGMQNYDLEALSKDRKRDLNRAKSILMKENEIYLNLHPEIKGFIAIILDHVLAYKPENNVASVLGDFFSRDRHQLAREVIDHLTEINCSRDSLREVRKRFFGRDNTPKEDIATSFDEICF